MIVVYYTALVMQNPRCLLIQVIDPHYHHDLAKANMVELTQLVHTLGGVIVGKVTQHRVKPDPGSYIGKGKLEWLKQEIVSQRVAIVVVNDIVKPSQLFRVERALWQTAPAIKVWDRVDLILAIFEKHAGSVEAKLQIELAKLDHKGPRIYGLGETELSRQGGGIGTRGKGETNIEFEKRQLKKRRQFLVERLNKVKKQKGDRIDRRSELGLGPVALVGYTSAGKTTLFNALTGKNKTTSAKLFTTLDTVVGLMKAPSGNLPIILSDTIGFIDQLPPQLIQAFESTLLESMSAKLILHMVDISDQEYPKKIEVVDQILTKLGANQPVLLVANKIDLVNKKTLADFRQFASGRESLALSAAGGQNIPQLKHKIWTHLCN